MHEVCVILTNNLREIPAILVAGRVDLCDVDLGGEVRRQEVEMSTVCWQGRDWLVAGQWFNC